MALPTDSQGASNWGVVVSLLQDEDECVRRIWNVVGVYKDAFNALFSFVRNEYQGLSSVHMSSDGLNNEDAKQLVNARENGVAQISFTDMSKSSERAYGT
jgi:hypothetical protein